MVQLKLTGTSVLYTLAGMMFLVRLKFNMIQSIFSHYQRSTGSAFPTTLRTLDTVILATLSVVAKSLLSEASIQTPMQLTGLPTLAPRTHFYKG